LDAAFSLDGKRIVTASRDRTARIWDAATGEPIAVLGGHDGPVRSAAFSPDGRLILTTSDDKTARLWDIGHIPPGNLVDIACAWLSDHDLTDVARDYGLTNLAPICQGPVPLPDQLPQ
jgi:WD40 repeat protein